MSTSNVIRSAQAVVRNPLLDLPAAAEFQQLPPECRAVLKRLLRQASAQARAKANHAWSKRKPPMASYWAAWSVNFRHASHLLKGD